MNMRNLFLLISLIIVPVLSSLAQVSDWVWARAGGGSSNESGYSVAADNSGNVYVAGTFSSNSAVFDTTTLSTLFSLKPALFLVKYDSFGNMVWARTAQGKVSYGMALAVDQTGNIYLTGGFESASIVFDSFTLSRDSLGSDIYLAKFDTNGNVIWAKRTGGVFNDQSLCVTTDSAGDIYVGGIFGGTFSFGSSTLISTGSYRDLFFARYSSNGTEMWAKSAGGIYEDQINSITLDAQGNIYFSGQFQSPQLILGNDTLINYGQSWDSFVAKCDPTGNYIWAKNPGSVDDDYAESVAVDNNGNVFISGNFRGSSISFDSVSLANNNTQNFDLYVAKYDNYGGLQWVKGAGGNSHDQSLALCIDASSNVYITGFFESLSINFGSINLTRPSSNGAEAFLASYDANGNELWAKKGTGAGYDWSQDVTCDNSGNVFITGYFGGYSILFGTQYVNSSANGNHTEVFVAKLGIPVGLSEVDEQDRVTIFPNPSNGIFFIRAPMIPVQIQILNSVGQVVKNLSIKAEEELKVNLTSDGIYFIRTTTQYESCSFKLMIQN